ncbi:hypothetical protein P3W45_000124 [Vairimorpha bombi]
MKDDFNNLIRSSVPYKESVSKENKTFSFPKYLPFQKHLVPFERADKIMKIIPDEEVHTRLFENVEDIFSKLKIISNKNSKLSHQNELNFLDEKENQINYERYEFTKEANDSDNESTKLDSTLCNYNFESKYLKPSKSEVFSITDPKYRINIQNMTDPRTTCMIKNIPNKYTQTMLISLLNEHHFGCFDFVYLRMDFKNKCNVGYAFVNFTKIEYIISFYYKINNKGWKMFSSNKIAELTYASIQGFDSLMNKFKNSLVMKEQESYRPKVFYKDGHFKGYEKPMSF